MGFWSNLKQSFLKDVSQKWMYGVSTLFQRNDLNLSFWEDLEETLILGDVGIDVTENIIESLQERARSRGITKAQDLREEFQELLISFFTDLPGTGQGIPLENKDTGPLTILLVGINGSGKTTTAGKLAYLLRQKGCSPILAGCDTFRAAAVDQLKVWGERTASRVVAQPYGSDPGAVLFDAIQASKAAKTLSPIVADTAGRLHNKQNLMAELGKIYRIAERESHTLETLLVIDTITGQNGLQQASAFQECLPLTGVILTKFDNTAKGGVVLSITKKLGLPIRYLGFGENIEELELFSPEVFVNSLLEERNA